MELLLALGSVAGIFIIVVGAALLFMAGVNALDRHDEKKDRDNE